MMFATDLDLHQANGSKSVLPTGGRAARTKKIVRNRTGRLLTTTALVSAAAMISAEAIAQVPAGYAPAPADVVSYVQLSNGSVLVQLANNQSLLVTSNNYFIDNSGVLYLSPSVAGNLSGSGGGTPAPLVGGGMPAGGTLAPPSSTGVLFDDTAIASSSGGMMGEITGGPGLFGLGTLGTIAAVGLGTGALILGVNAVRNRLSDDTAENSAATIAADDSEIVKGETSGNVTYTISDADGIDQSVLKEAVEAGLGGASTVASIFPNGGEVTVDPGTAALVSGTEDTYASLQVTVTGEVQSNLNTGEFPGPAVAFKDAKGNDESVNFSLNISDPTDTGGTGSLELDASDGSAHEIAQGGSKLFKATDPQGDTISYEISNNPSGIAIDSNTGLVVVSSAVSTGSYTITVKASSTGSDGTVETDTETYTINVTAGSGGSSSVNNTVNADFDSTNAGFSTLSGLNTTNNNKTDNGDNEFEVVDNAHLGNSYVIDGLGGNDTLYFSERDATYHLDPMVNNSFEDVAGFETLELLSSVHLDVNGGVFDSATTGDINHLKGSGDNKVRLVKEAADLGLDVVVTDIQSIDMDGHDLTLDRADIGQIDKIMDDSTGTLVFTGAFVYDFAEALLTLEDVQTIGLDGGNYSYSLTLDGFHDEDVREIVSDGNLILDGDTNIDTRLNEKITLIDLSRGMGSDGNNNIFATFDDPMTIRGGTDTDDVDLTLKSDIEAGELIIDLGKDSDDTVNFNLNGEDIDMTGDGRILRGVEYVDVDTADGDGEVMFQFNGSGVNVSDIRDVDLGDLDEEGGVILRGDLSTNSAHNQGLITSADFVRSLNTTAPSTYTIGGANAAIAYGGTINAAYFTNALMAQDGTTALTGGTGANEGSFEDTTGTVNVTDGLSVTGQMSVVIDGFVADADLEIEMTAGDDEVDLIIGETELSLTLDDEEDADTNYGAVLTGAVAQNVTIASLLGSSTTGAGTANQVVISTVEGVADSSIAEASEAVTVDLAGGDDILSIVLGSTQEKKVTIKIASAQADEEDIIRVDALEDLAGTPAADPSTANSAKNVVFDFENDITTIIESTSTSAAALNETGSSAGALIVFGGAAAGGGTQAGILYDADGDGELSDGDTVLDLTNAITHASLDVDALATEIEFDSNLGDQWNFVIGDGNLQDII